VTTHGWVLAARSAIDALALAIDHRLDGAYGPMDTVLVQLFRLHVDLIALIQVLACAGDNAFEAVERDLRV
jgi:hypothetical protein